jgi:predicted ATPase/class 3 adenylate cyclase
VSQLPTGTVTFLFTDLERSTRLWEEQPEAMKAALARHDELLAEAVGAHGGHVIKGTGDGLHAVFSTAQSAVAASIAGQRALAAEPWSRIGPFRVRMGVHTGVADQRAGDYFGPVVNRAARLMAVAYPGQILCSQATADLARDALPASIGVLELGGYRLGDLDRPEVLFQVTHPDLDDVFPPPRTADAPAGNLPRQVTSFVGHEDQLTAIAAELEQSAVVTLTGVGGVGKTRLALEAAARQGPRYRDGVWLCALASVREADGVPDAALEAFRVEPRQGVRAEEVLRQFLRAKELLLVLDNCEHLLRPVARLVTEVVRECRGVRVLATSREGLSISGERIMVVPSLDVPVSTQDLDAIAASNAVQLFVSRAQGVRAGFMLDTTNAASVAQICQRLDGVPLAIELAAARAAMLTPAELARRLDQRFRVLTGSERGVVERHQTLRASIDWSYELLGDAERQLLDRLSVFVGGFTLAAAEAVTSGDGIERVEVFELLAGLVARSLVVADTEGAETRYRLLETIRQYAQERFELDGTATQVRDAHLGYFTTFVEDVAAGMSTAAELEWVERAAREADNMRAALAWAIETENAEAILRFFGREELWSGFSEIGRVLEAAAPAALGISRLADDCRYPLMLAFAAMHVFGRGDVEKMRRYCEDALAAEARLGCEPSVSVAAARSMVGTAAGDVDELLAYRERAIAICRARQDDRALAFNLANSALGHALEGKDIALAVAEVDEALSVAQQVAAPRVVGVVQGFAAFVLADVDPERARALMRAAMAAKASNRIPGPIESMLGDVAERLGDRRQALELFAKGLEQHHWLGQPELVGRALRRIGLLLADHDPETAAVLVGAAVQGSRAMTLTKRVQDQHARGIAALGAVLGRQPIPGAPGDRRHDGRARRGRAGAHRGRPSLVGPRCGRPSRAVRQVGC